MQGDTDFSTWATDGTVYMMWNDGWGPSASGGASGGCSANLGVATISSNLQTITRKNCMTSFGTSAQTNTGGWSDGRTWKSTGILYVNDGSTPTGLYVSVERQLDSAPWSTSYASIMYSSDGGTTWCNPAGTCNTNGAAPAANTGEFTAFARLNFVQYEKGSSGTITTDCNNSYIYAYVTEANTTFLSYLARIARGSNLQVASNWSYYSGTVGGNACTSGNWTSSFASATPLFGPGQYDANVIYIPNLGYVMDTIYGNGLPGWAFFYSSSITGPWQLALADEPIASQPYGFSQPMLHTVSQVGSVITLTIYYGGNYTRDTGTGSTPYSPFFRTMTITLP